MLVTCSHIANVPIVAGGRSTNCTFETARWFCSKQNFTLSSGTFCQYVQKYTSRNASTFRLISSNISRTVCCRAILRLGLPPAGEITRLLLAVMICKTVVIIYSNRLEACGVAGTVP